jgi:dTDP-L-rhamnose 4-epimerase
MRVLISGGAGFIGSSLSLALVARGHLVTVLDNLSPQIHADGSHLFESIRDRVEFIHGDVRCREDWARALKDKQAVVHLAAETGTGQSMYQIEQYVNVNVTGTAILLDLLANGLNSVKRIVVASSRAIYGEGKYFCDRCGIVYPSARRATDMQVGDFCVKCPTCEADVHAVPTDEDSRIHPSSLYGITKQSQEQMIMAMALALGTESVALRYQNVYGPGQSLSNPYTGILSIFSTRIRNGNEVVVFEDGRESRDFVYIDDVVEATILALEHPAAAYQVFNVGSGVRTEVAAIAQLLIDAYDARVDLRISGNFRVGDIRDNFADLSRIESRLGFRPKVCFQDGIRRFAEWVVTQGNMPDRYEESIRELKVRGLYK